MKLKLTVRRAGGEAVDVLTTLDAGTTVGDLARTLLVRDPKAPTSGLDGSWTLQVVSADRRELDPYGAVSDSGLLSGATVSVMTPSASSQGDAVQSAAVVRILEGPDAGKEFKIGRGTNHVGRASGCEVRLTDTSVSREHAKLQISDVAEIVDLGSSNGVSVAGGGVPRAVLRPNDEVRIGDTLLVVEVLEASAAGASGTSIPFNRSPRLDPAYTGPELLIPDPPERQVPQRFPVIALIAPLLFGGAVFAIRPQPSSLIFIALSPFMLLANAIESRVSGKKAFVKALEIWRAELVELTTELASASIEEVSRRLREHPSTADVRHAITQRDSLLWTRRPQHERFLELRIGLGTRSSRNAVKLPSNRKCEKALWSEVEAFSARASKVAGVPVIARLKDGPLGVAGPRDTALSVGRAMVLQVVGLHSPAETVLAAILASDTVEAWDWLKWLPHTSSPHSPLSCQHLAGNPAAASVLVSELELLVSERVGEQDAGPSVVVLVEDGAATDRARLVTIAERGAELGVHIIWLAPSVDRLPAACATFVDVPLGGTTGLAGYTDDGRSVTPLVVETADATDVPLLGRHLAPMVDSGAPLDDDSDLPRSVSWLSLHDRSIATYPAAVLERWQESRSIMTGAYARPPRRGKPGSLRAVLGQNAGEPHTLDLRTHGPHALVGGTTGSGKSELLQSWILGMAAAHSPERVTFLLVDYKGGSAFRECLNLPHTVGLVTDLSPHLVRRALTSLSAELKRREELLAHKRKKDLQDLEQTGDPETPPSLIIVVDEFAALVQEVPEFVEGVVNVAQRGRSLGLHLILATQRPAGVIKDNLRANTNLRLALRVADEGDSTDVIGTPQAAAFDPALPGRAVSKTGPGRLIPFQAAYAGGWTSDEPPPPQIVIEELTLGAKAAWEEPEAAEADVAPELGPTDIARVVSTICAATELAALPEARKPWLPELEDVYELGSLPTARRDDEMVFGVADDPHSQQQPTISFLPDRDGNLAVYGTGGSGKSGLLRALAVAAGFTFRGGPCRVYGMDFGARGLDMLSDLPHVGSIIAGSDHERISRLLSDVRALIDERAARYAQTKAGTITEYRDLAAAPDEPRLLLLVDGVAAFRSTYEATDKTRWWDLFQSIAVDGRPVGVHVILSADRPAAIPLALGSSIQRRVVLRLAEEGDYSTLGEAADVLSLASPPGRALIDGQEVQVAILGGTRNTLQQAQAIGRLAETMRRAGIPIAPPVDKLVEHVRLADLPTHIGDEAVIGVGGSKLGPVGIPTRGAFLITGPPGSGRTTALQTILQSALRAAPDSAVYYVGNRRSPLAGLPGLAGVAVDVGTVVNLATSLATSLAAGAVSGKVVLIVEALSDFVNSPADLALQQLLKLLIADDHFVIAEGESTTLSSGAGLVGLVRAARTGLALQPESYDGTIFRTDFPKTRRADLPTGRAQLVVQGRALLMQVALPMDGFVPKQGSATHSLLTP